MPRISISVVAPSHPSDQEILNLDLPPALSIGDLKGFVNAETNIPQEQQHFYLNNVELQPDSKSLDDAGVKDGDMLAMLRRQQQSTTGNGMGGQRRAQRAPQQQSSSPGRMRPEEIETTRLSLLGNAGAMAQVREQRPALAEAINDPNRFREAWVEMERVDRDREEERLEQMRLLNEDPFNEDAQRKIEEMIRQQSVQENLQHAYEHNPEVFGRVTMLYIPVTVNRTPIKAFVDSGAQTTIMSPSCAETCGIMRLIDKRYSGVAHGVGTAQILGRVHSADIKIGNQNMACSFTVMEGKDVDLLLGLDMLKRFQGIIDLRKNQLIFGEDNAVDFLGEADIPKSFEAAQANEPTVPGPNGTEIGAETGTVKKTGAASSSTSSAAPTTNGNFGGAGHTTGTSASSSGKAAASSTPAPAAQPARTEYPKEAIDSLVGLGFSRPQAIAALDACGGNVEYAAGLLFQS